MVKVVGINNSFISLKSKLYMYLDARILLSLIAVLQKNDFEGFPLLVFLAFEHLLGLLYCIWDHVLSIFKFKNSNFLVNLGNSGPVVLEKEMFKTSTIFLQYFTIFKGSLRIVVTLINNLDPF